MKDVVVVVVLTLTRIIKSVVTGQAPVTLELRNTPGRKHKPKVVHAYITADAIHAPTRNMYKVKSGVNTYHVQCPPSRRWWLEIPKVSQVENGEHRHPCEPSISGNI